MLCLACGEDRTYEFEEKTKETHWIYSVMDQWYLWYGSMPEITDYKQYFSDAEAFFKKLLYSGDKYSYLEKVEEEADTRTINAYASYGFDFNLYIDPVTQSQSSTRRYARVLYVLPQSPAAVAGLKRGDWISAVGGEELTSKNYTALINGEATTLTTSILNYDRPDSLYWEEQTDTLQLAAARKLEDNPFYVDTLYQTAGRRIAYLMYNRFSTGPEDSGNETQYRNEMRSIFGRFKQQQPTDFILDLRYNPGGYLICAQDLASLLAPQEVLDEEVFYSLTFNDKMTERNEKAPFEASLTDGNNLNLSRLYIITTELTASASESVINGLTPVMGKENIILVGTRTEGKNVASLTFNSDFGITLHPIVATVYNGRGESDYSEGFEPAYKIDENQYADPWKPLGDTDELLLHATLSIILGDDAQAAATRHSTAPLLPAPVYSTVGAKGLKGARLTETIHVVAE